MELLNNIIENKFVMMLLTEKQYEQKLSEIVKNYEHSSSICYVCLSKPFADTISTLKKMGIDTSKFSFIDILSSYYGVQKAPNCIFLKVPVKLEDLQSAIKKTVSEKNCDVVIFDTISSLLMYQQSHDLLKFTHDLAAERKNQDVHKVFIVLKEYKPLDSNLENFIKDVGMFSDKTIDFSIGNGGA